MGFVGLGRHRHIWRIQQKRYAFTTIIVRDVIHTYIRTQMQIYKFEDARIPQNTYIIHTLVNMHTVVYTISIYAKLCRYVHICLGMLFRSAYP